MQPDMIREIEHLKKRVDTLESMLRSDPAVAPKSVISAREFMLNSKADDSVAKTLLAGYFLERFGGLQSFTVKELEHAFVAAKERVPTNTNDMINKNISRNFMMAAKEKRDNKKTWCLTNAGQKHVETNLVK